MQCARALPMGTSANLSRMTVATGKKRYQKKNSNAFSRAERSMIARISLCALLFLLIAPFAFADHAVSINSADKAALTTLTGIGEVKAQAIIDYRNANGPFANIEDVMNVSGIGPATFNSIKDHITIAVTSGQPRVEQSKGEEKTGS